MWVCEQIAKLGQKGFCDWSRGQGDSSPDSSSTLIFNSSSTRGLALAIQVSVVMGLKGQKEAKPGERGIEEACCLERLQYAPLVSQQSSGNGKSTPRSSRGQSYLRRRRALTCLGPQGPRNAFFFFLQGGQISCVTPPLCLSEP